MFKRMMVVGLIMVTLISMVGCGSTNQEDIKEKASSLVEELNKENEKAREEAGIEDNK